MQITAVQTIPNIMPKHDPAWRIAYGAFPDSQGLLVKILTDSGLTGFGYGSSNPPYKTIPQGFLQSVFDRFAPCLVGQNPFNLERILTDIDHAPLSGLSNQPDDIEWGRTRARSAIEIALHDLSGKALGVPIYQLLGGMVREEVPVRRIIAIKEPVDMAKNALRLCQEGYRYIKIKLEGDPVKDIQRIKAVRESVGVDVHLTVDANQSYSTKDAIEAIKEMERYNIDLVEQPVPEHDVEGIIEVSRASRGTTCQVEAHETVDTVDKVFQLAKSDFTGFFNVSLTLGGFRSLKTAVDICKLAGVKCVITCIGTRLLSAASLHFAASCANLDYACQLGEFARFHNDPASGLEVENGMLRVPRGPGLGIQVNV